jgi:hypothetical protein
MFCDHAYRRGWILGKSSLAKVGVPEEENGRGRTQMKTRAVLSTIAALLAVVLLAAVPAIAQQIYGTPGSPSATMTIDGKQLPPPPTSCLS